MQRNLVRDDLALSRGLLAAVAWGVFAAAWVLVVRRPGAVVFSAQLLVIPLAAVLVTVISTWWIRHNRRIYQRKGPRRGIPFPAGPLGEDRLGRPVHLDLPTLAGVQEVVLETSSLGKTYRIAP